MAREFRHMVEHLQFSSKSEDFKNHCSELIANIDKIQEEGLRKEDITAGPAAAKVCSTHFVATGCKSYSRHWQGLMVSSLTFPFEFSDQNANGFHIPFLLYSNFLLRINCYY